MIDEVVQRLAAVLFLVFRENRHKCLGKCTLGEQAAHEVWYLEGDKEGVSSPADAKDCGQSDIAYQTKHAREQGHATYGQGGFQQFDAQRGSPALGISNGLKKRAIVTQIPQLIAVPQSSWRR